MFVEYIRTNPLYYVSVVMTCLISITIHELAHGITAIWLGDRTPIEQERMTFNPLVHMGGVSIAALFLVGIAWGLMPVTTSRLRGKYGDAIVAVAGPVSNLLLALLALTACGVMMRRGMFADTTSINVMYLLLIFGQTNVMLALFNLLPVPPLDGSRIAANFIPAVDNVLRTMTPQQMLVPFLIVFMFAGRLLWPAADRISDGYLSLIRGY